MFAFAQPTSEEMLFDFKFWTTKIDALLTDYQVSANGAPSDYTSELTLFLEQQIASHDQNVGKKNFIDQHIDVIFLIDLIHFHRKSLRIRTSNQFDIMVRQTLGRYIHCSYPKDMIQCIENYTFYTYLDIIKPHLIALIHTLRDLSHVNEKKLVFSHFSHIYNAYSHHFIGRSVCVPESTLVHAFAATCLKILSQKTMYMQTLNLDAVQVTHYLENIFFFIGFCVQENTLNLIQMRNLKQLCLDTPTLLEDLMRHFPKTKGKLTQAYLDCYFKHAELWVKIHDVANYFECEGLYCLKILTMTDEHTELLRLCIFILEENQRVPHDQKYKIYHLFNIEQSKPGDCILEVAKQLLQLAQSGQLNLDIYNQITEPDVVAAYTPMLKR